MRQTGIRANFLAGLVAWVAGLASELNYGLIAFSPLILARFSNAWDGVLAALLSAIVANLFVLCFGGRAAMTTGGRPMLSILLAAYLTHLLSLPGLGQIEAPLLISLCALCLTLAGLFQVLFGALKLGRVIKYIPYPVFSGFSLAAALMLISAAWHPLLGVPMVSHDFAGVFEKIKPLAALVGSVSLLAGYFGPLVFPKLPRLLLAFLVGFSADLLLRLSFGSALGETLPAVQMMHLVFPVSNLSLLSDSVISPVIGQVVQLTVTTALSLAVMASLETLMTNASLDHQLSTRVSGDQQLMAHGMGNLASGLVAGIPCAPSVSRATLISRHGGRTHLVSLTYIAVFVLVLLFPQPLTLIPESVLGALMILVAFSLIDSGMVELARQLLFQRHKLARSIRRQINENALILLSVAIIGVALGLLQAIVVGVIISTVLFLQNNRREVVRRILSGQQHRSRRVRDRSGVKVLDEHGAKIAIVEAQGPLYFATADRLISELERLAKDCLWIILDCRRVTQIDSTGAHFLGQSARFLDRQGCSLRLAYVAPESDTGQVLRNLHLDQALSLQHWYSDTDRALEACETALIQQSGIDATRGPAGIALVATDLGACLAEEAAENVLQAHLRKHCIREGEILFRQGEPGNSLYVVTRGAISLELSLEQRPGASRRRLATYMSGVIFGEMAFIETGLRSADARAETDVELFELTRAGLEEIQKKAPEVANQLLLNISLTLCRRLRTCNWQLAELEAL